MTYGQYMAELDAQDIFNDWVERDECGNYADREHLESEISDVCEKIEEMTDDGVANDAPAMVALADKLVELTEALDDLERVIKAEEAEMWQEARYQAGADDRPAMPWDIAYDMYCRDR